MLTNPEIWQNLLQWNKIRIIYNNPTIWFEIKFLVVTYNCGLIGLATHRIKRLELIKKLSDSGMSNKDIAQYLNDRNLKTPKGKSYYGNLIWATLKKYRDRLERKNTKAEIVWTKEQLFIEKPYV